MTIDDKVNDCPAPGSFRQAVYAVVRTIPAGRVATYGQVARLAGRPGAARHSPLPPTPWVRKNWIVYWKSQVTPSLAWMPTTTSGGGSPPSAWP